MTAEHASSPTHTLSAENLAVGYPGGKPVVDNVSLEIPAGDITVMIGANGSGKSTLLRTLAGALAPLSGRALLDGQPVDGLARREVARALSLLPQTPSAPEGLTIRQLCDFGRSPHRGMLGRARPDDAAAIDHALDATDLHELADAKLDAISGGQRQRAWLAMALAQQAPFMLLDEPTTYLDLGHQLELLDLLRRLNRERGTTVVMVLHDLHLAAHYADRIIAVADGRIVADGPPEKVVTQEMVAKVFRVRAEVIEHPFTHRPLTLPMETL